MPTLLSSSSQRADESVRAQLLQLFGQLLALDGVEQTLDQSRRRFYRRIWCPVITLWYLLWQRLQYHHTLQGVVTDLRHGGADALRPGDKKPLSQRVLSNATTAFSKARGRVPLDWVKSCFHRWGQRLAALALAGPSDGLPVRLWDGSTLRMRPLGDLPKKFPPHRTRRKKSYWCVARVVVGFCAGSGVVLSARMGSLHLSEQALAVVLILASAPALHLGDRNFGVWRVVRASVQSGGQALMRLTGARANKLAAGRRLKPGLDLAVEWTPSPHDQVDPGLEKKGVAGRLVVVRTQRRGFRTVTLFLFTTLADTVAYPPERLLVLYGWRWQVELNFRTLKATMGLAQLEVKSADLAQKEFYAGLMAYNLVRGLMGVAARTVGCGPAALSFAGARAHLTATLSILWLSWLPGSIRWDQWQRLVEEVSRARLPRRKRPRASEPRAQCYAPRVFPPLRTSRNQARKQLKKTHAKS
jgi:hypothetical protein